jgi:uncharacterized membrane protein YedE/YeeE
MNTLLAIIFGLLFGFVLQKAGAANPKRIIDMLRLKDLHLMKTILLSIGVSSLALFVFLSAGFIDASNLSIKASYVGVIAGGGIFGLGWAISGFCPGTGVVAAGAGRKDAWVFILGALFGAFIFTLMYASLKSTFLFDALGGKASFASTENDKFITLLPSIPPSILAGGIALLLIFIAWKLPEEN